MSKRKWTINNSGGGSDGSDLIGCHIKETDTGCQFLDPENAVLASTTSTSPPFTFPSFDFGGWEWSISVATLATSGVTGAWSNNNPGPEGEEGTWATGAGADEEEEAAAACS